MSGKPVRGGGSGMTTTNDNGGRLRLGCCSQGLGKEESRGKIRPGRTGHRRRDAPHRLATHAWLSERPNDASNGRRRSALVHRL